MIIQVGKSLKSDGDYVIVLNIPKLGSFKTKCDYNDDFPYIELNKEQLLILLKLIEEELKDE